MTTTKVLTHWGRLFLRAVICNMLVALALWFATASEDTMVCAMLCRAEHSQRNL
jgi:formate/nitrite transporter FocA (FNT family)